MLRPLLVIAMVFTHLRGTSVNMADIAPGLFNYLNAFIIHGMAVARYRPCRSLPDF